MKDSDLKLYIDLAEHVIKNTGRMELDHNNAIEIKNEAKKCLKHNYEFNSYWQLASYELFNRHNIKDERITDRDLLKELKFEHNGKQYTTEIRYINFTVDKFPEESRLVLNDLHKPEAEFLRYELKSALDRFDDCDPSKVYLWKNYALIFRK
jgi:hypothetical protein